MKSGQIVLTLPRRSPSLALNCRRQLPDGVGRDLTEVATDQLPDTNRVQVRFSIRENSGDSTVSGTNLDFSSAGG